MLFTVFPDTVVERMDRGREMELVVSKFYIFVIVF